MTSSPKANWSDLAIRLASAVVMAGLALVANWFGGVWFSLFWLVAAIAVLAEWLFLVTPGAKDWLGVGLGTLALCLACWLAALNHAWLALFALIAGGAVLGALAFARQRAFPCLIAVAVPYAGAVVIPVQLLRLNDPWGLQSILVLFAIVWGSDIMAYFTGRTLGGPKLWPRVSPKKTWSGFIGGVVFGGLFAGLVAGSLVVGLVGSGLAAISQGGDLLESALKRRFDAKDASHLIPGHGGVMDRLDGFLAAALAALIIGVLHAGANPAFGLLVW